MRLDLDLAAAILEAIEADDRADGTAFRDVLIEGRTTKEISYHVALLADAGLIVAREVADFWRPRRLTWAGHWELDRLRRESESVEHEGLRALPRSDDRPPLTA